MSRSKMITKPRFLTIYEDDNDNYIDVDDEKYLKTRKRPKT